jgi:serine/threonine-protein kinase
LAFIDRHEIATGEGDPNLGATIAGRFTILARLGRGSMGSVYRARQQAMGRDVALKIVRRDRAYDPETKARFEREARAISSLTSHHTVTAFDFGEAEDGSWFLAMEMLEGESVGDRLRRQRRIDWVDAVRFAREALTSLAEAHEKGIIHRDLKPDNLFLTRLPANREICKVLDFGIAKWQVGGEAPIDQLETQAGTVFGTPRYMSPEQAQGNPLDARSDLYSLGVLLYQMLSGRAPFVDDDAVVVMARHIKDEPPTFADAAADAEVPGPIEDVVRRALSKSPADRQQTAEEMSAELERAVDLSRAAASGVQTAITPVESVASPKPWHKAAAWVALGGVVGGLALWAFRSDALVSEKSANEALVRSRASAGALLPSPPATLVTPPARNREAANPAEISSAAAATTQPSSSASSRARVVRPHSAASAGSLPRKGNERYGRFE